MGVSEDSESIVSGRVVTREEGILPLTIDLCSGRAGAGEYFKYAKIVTIVYHDLYHVLTELVDNEDYIIT